MSDKKQAQKLPKASEPVQKDSGEFSGMKLSRLSPTHRSRHRPKVIGRGIGSGHGKTSTRGTKGQLARSGAKHPPGWEGGTTPLIRRIPKRGFSRGRFRESFTIVNLFDIDRIGTLLEVTPQTLREAGLVKRGSHPVKVLGDGELKRALKVHVHAISQGAKNKIEAAGGTVSLIVNLPKESHGVHKVKKIKMVK